MICKDCEKMKKMANTDECRMGICSNAINYFMVNADDECVFERPIILHCSDCSRFENDYACLTVKADDIAENCSGFIDKREEGFRELLHIWSEHDLKTNKEISEIVNRILEEEGFKA